MGELVPPGGEQGERVVAGQKPVAHPFEVDMEHPFDRQNAVGVVEGCDSACRFEGSDVVVDLHQDDDDEQFADQVGTA